VFERILIAFQRHLAIFRRAFGNSRSASLTTNHAAP
jgi:uncharacterized membrane protein YkgB